jgi:hypothetical protein
VAESSATVGPKTLPSDTLTESGCWFTHDPMARGEITAKFDALAAGIIGQRACDESAEIFSAMEHERDMLRLIASLQK